MYGEMVYCGMQAKSICICTYDGSKVGLLYNNASYVCDVKCIESDSHSDSYTQAYARQYQYYCVIFKLILAR